MSFWQSMLTTLRQVSGRIGRSAATRRVPRRARLTVESLQSRELLSGNPVIGMNLEATVDRSPARACKAIRFLHGTDIVASDVVRPSDPRSAEAHRQAGALQNGIAPEYLVGLANELHADPWFRMPHLADDDFVRHFATLVRDTLDPGPKVFAEWLSEGGNHVTGFEIHLGL